MKEKIKMKLVYLWYDYLQYKLVKSNKRLLRLYATIDALEVKYMHKEVYDWDWSKIAAIDESNYISKIDSYETQNQDSKD